ncbi:MAG: universal stress protein [Proteobacteria bacterium]|nr:universal stress protein [Pseudomonadota bacterium]MBU4470216.1 universal stress protein [Pseudomonadota bacterium]MCG2752632.1 universal stress protein [Desulfobacteraceae bacterium]
MFLRFLIIFEGEKICEKALAYSRELALRMDSEVTLLGLVEMDFKQKTQLESRRKTISSIKNQVGKALSGLSSEFVKIGISVSVAIRVGDPAEELLKFLAERTPFQTIIWGSTEEPPDSQSGARNHWIKRVTDKLECPIFTVKAKGNGISGETPGRS